MSSTVVDASVAPRALLSGIANQSRHKPVQETCGSTPLGNETGHRNRRVATEEAKSAVQFQRLIRRRIRKSESGIDLAADVNAVVSVNVNESGTTTASTVRTDSSSPSDRPRDGSAHRGKENP
jgi:hypothetical protein